MCIVVCSRACVCVYACVYLCMRFNYMCVYRGECLLVTEWPFGRSPRRGAVTSSISTPPFVDMEAPFRNM
jgi:hypothetical protein